MVLMYICICNAITERQVKEAVAQGATSLSDLQSQVGVATCCGACAETAIDYLPGGQYAGENSLFATQVSRVVEETTSLEDEVHPTQVPFYAAAMS